MNSIPIRYSDLRAIQLQLLFEERILAGFEKQAIKYCRWLLKMSEAEREVHHRSLSRMAHAVRTAHGLVVDIAPDCECPMCAEWHIAAMRELHLQAEEEWARREAERKMPRPPRPTFIYLVLDENSGYIKIGRAREPSVRERTLQSEKPRVKMFFVAPADADLERELHQKYARFQRRGEWFQLSVEQVEEVKQRIGSTKNPK